MAKFLLIFFTVLLFSSSNAEEIYGEAKIIDGDTIHIKSIKIRLEGIDAPEIKQKCKKKYLKISTTPVMKKIINPAIVGINFDKDYSCGIVSKKQLAKKINNVKISCISSTKDKYKRYLATCYKKNINLNKWMVRNGHAVAYKRYSKQYVNDENYAKKNKLGIWQGQFIRPEKWRKLN